MGQGTGREKQDRQSNGKMSHSLESFTEHVADSIRENLKETQTMKDTTTLQQVADQIENLYSVDHTRMEKAISIVKAQGIKKLSNGNYQVPSETDANHLYQVNLDHPRCNCMDYAKQSPINPEHVCKHMAASLVWNTLPDVKVVPQELQQIYAVLFPTVKVIA